MLLGWFALANGWRLLVVVLGAAALHEAGHALVLRILGIPIAQIRLGICGAEMTYDGRLLSYGGELLAVLAGPGVNFLCGAALSAAGLPAAAGAHWLLGGFNLLPVRPLDGGRAMHLVLCWLLGPSLGERLTCGIGGMTALLLAGILAAVMYASGGSLWLLPPMGGMLISAFREAQGLLHGKVRFS